MKNSPLMQINRGDIVNYEQRIVTIVDFKLSPNGINDMSLVCVVFAEDARGNIVSATSNKFYPLPEQDYEEFYPSVHLINL